MVSNEWSAILAENIQRGNQQDIVLLTAFRAHKYLTTYQQAEVIAWAKQRVHGL